MDLPRTASPPIAPFVDIDDEQLLEIIAHLGAALMQVDPSIDDPIIVSHMHDAHRLALELHRSRPAAAATREIEHA